MPPLLVQAGTSLGEPPRGVSGQLCASQLPVWQEPRTHMQPALEAGAIPTSGPAWIWAPGPGKTLLSPTPSLCQKLTSCVSLPCVHTESPLGSSVTD